jgi:outer membrane lipoprotein-sorting protein
MCRTAFSICVTLFAFHCRAILGAELSAEEVLKKVESTYKSLKTYQAEGVVENDFQLSGNPVKTKTTFSMSLQKPNQYLIRWEQTDFPMPGMNQAGSVWSNGSQPFLYMEPMNAYAKIADDDTAIASATGISGGVAFTVPSLFLSIFEKQPTHLSRLIDPKLLSSEKIEGDDCYVLRGSSDVSKEETFWISKANFLIRQYRHSLEPPEGGRKIPEIDDAQLEESIKAMGREVTEESKQEIREMMEQAEEILASSDVKGTITETYTKLSSQPLKTEDFNFDLPQGVVLKDSLFGMP